MIQVDIKIVTNAGNANEVLRNYPQLYPKRKIIGVNMHPIDTPGGWFLVITYEV